MLYRRGFALLLCGMAACTARVERQDASEPDSTSPLSSADSLLALGEEQHGRGQFDSARTSLERALATAESERNEKFAALVLTRIGLASWRLGQIAHARTMQDSALRMKLRLGMADELSRSYNGLGLIALSENRNVEAAAQFQKAVESAAAVDDHAGIARATGNAGLAYAYLGDLQRARQAHRTMRTAGAQLGERLFEANALANEAMVDVSEGDPVSAVARLDTARVIYREISSTVGEQNALGQLATAYALMGEYGTALAVMDSALVLARSRTLAEQEVEILRLLGGMHMRTGDHRRAIRYFEQAEAVALRAGVEAELGSVLRGSSEAYLQAGNLRDARTRAVRALAMHTESGEPLERIEDLLLLARVEGQAGARALAAEHLQSAAELAHTAGTRGARAQVILAHAEGAERSGDAREMLRLVAALPAETIRHDYDVRWRSASLAARAYARLGRYDSAAARGREAVAALERTRAGIAFEPLRNTFAAERSAVFGDLVLALLHLGGEEEAFEVADRARSRALLEHFAAARRTVRGNAGRQDLVEAEQMLRRIDALVNALREREPARPRLRGEPATEEDGIHAELAAARADYEALLVRAAARDPAAVAIAGSATPSLRAVRSALRADEALVEYFIAPGTLVTFVTRRDGLQVVRTDISEQTLVERIRLLRDVWGRPRRDWQTGLRTSDALYADLIAPARDAGLLGEAVRLIIVPHGLLAQVPFAALRDPQSGRFLVTDFSLLQTPSASGFVALRGRAREESMGAMAWGFAPRRRELPASVREVMAFRRAVGSARAELGSRATETRLRQALESGSIVHVATHGVLNRRQPMFSRIELAMPRVATEDDDGRLEVRELLGVNVRSSLVFLSGCETGVMDPWLPDPVRGSGELTISHAFLLAGARNVVSTLWRIDDAGAGAFANRFYAHLDDNDTADALTRAQRSMQQDQRYSNPYYWAGYVLSGDGQGDVRAARTVAASVR